MQRVPTKIVFWLTPIMCTVALGCAEFATPAELDRAQILAIVAEPPAVGPGESSTLTILVAGPDGAIAQPQVVWSASSISPEVPPLGTLADEQDGTATYMAPPTQPADNPALALIEARVEVGRDMPLIGSKAIAVGSIVLANPTLTRFDAGGTDLLTVDELSLRVGTPTALEIDVEGGFFEEGSVSWYATGATIEQYRSNPTEILAEEAGEGWLFVVARDGRGGVVWREVHLTASM
jgi:hypothetical protein